MTLVIMLHRIGGSPIQWMNTQVIHGSPVRIHKKADQNKIDIQIKAALGFWLVLLRWVWYLAWGLVATKMKPMVIQFVNQSQPSLVTPAIHKMKTA